MPKFLRQDYMRHSRLGKGRKKLQKWRRPTGKHSKIRRKRSGYPAAPTIGYGSPRSEAYKVNGVIPVLVHNVKELEKLTKNSMAILAKVGAKNKLAMIKKASELNIKILNVSGAKHATK